MTKSILAVAASMLVIQSVSQAQFVVFNNGALVTVSAGCIATVKTGDLVNDVGTVNNAGSITIEGDLVNNDVISGAGAATGLFAVRDNWVNNQTFNADQSRVELYGTNQSITGTAISSFYNLTLLGSGIKTMTLDANVLGTLTLSGLELATQTNTLRVLNTATNAIAAGGGFVSSQGAGRLSRAMNSSASYLFPLGSSVGTPRIRPLAVAPLTGSAHTYAARMANVNATSEGFDVNNTDVDICQVNDQFFHLLERTNGSDAADITQYFIAAQDGNWDRGGHWQNVPQWENMGNAVLASIAPYNTLTVSGWSNFSTSAFALVKALPAVTMDGFATGTCVQGNSIGLNATPAGGSFSGPGVIGSQFSPSVAGIGQHTLTYTYMANNGCANTASQNIEVYAQPQISITSTQPAPFQLCQGQSLTLSATAGFNTYLWSTNANGESIGVNSSGTYSVTASDANGCQGTSLPVSVSVNPVPTPVITAGGPLQFCQGGSVMLSTSAGFGSYNWSNGGTGISTMITNPGTYTVSVTNQFLCSGTSAPISVSVITPQTSMIENVGDSMYVVPSTGSGYQWFLNGSPIPGANGPTYMGQESGNYTVQFTDGNGCTSNSFTLEFTYSGGNIGLEEHGIFSLLDLYPNPGRGQFSVRGLLPSNMNVRIAITDMLGRILMPDVVLSATDQFTQEFDISELANGVYFVRIQVNERQLTVRYVKS